MHAKLYSALQNKISKENIKKKKVQSNQPAKNMHKSQADIELMSLLNFTLFEKSKKDFYNFLNAITYFTWAKISEFFKDFNVKKLHLLKKLSSKFIKIHTYSIKTSSHPLKIPQPKIK